MANYLLFLKYAGVAQLVEQLICNQWGGGSIPLAGSILYNGLLVVSRSPFFLVGY